MLPVLSFEGNNLNLEYYWLKRENYNETGICGDKSINYFYLHENTCQRYHSLKVQVNLPPERACEGIETRNIIKLEIF